eukprot:Clim_evm6s1 gene=Clim_evmTU6s1
MVAEDKFVNSEPTTRLSLEGIDAVDKLRKTSAFEALGDTDHSIPCLDIEWAFASEANKLTTAKELHSVLRDTGFMCVKNHGIDLYLKERMEFLSRKFFHLPKEVKQKYAEKQFFRGWIPYCSEVVGNGEYRDIKESYLPPVWPSDLQDLWVEEIPEFKPTLNLYMDSVRECGVKMNKLMALSLGLDEDYFNRELFWNGIGYGNELVRLNYYPENQYSDSSRGTYGLGEHTDFGWLTFLGFDGKRGLEIQRPDGSWFMPVNVTREMLIINLGDFVKRLTNGRYRSTLHRVHNPDGKERVSFPIFFNPNYNVIGKPIEKLLEPGEKPLYEPMTFGEHILHCEKTVVRSDKGKMPTEEQLANGGHPKNVTRDTIVINQGDFVKRVTNGKYRSMMHRVHNPAGKERVSFPFFFNPNYTVVGKPVEKLLQPGEQPLYEPMTFGEHILHCEKTICRTDQGQMPDLEELARAGQ